MLNDTSEVHTPYGATEAVPIISAGSHEILSETRALSEQGYGMCVGRPIGEVDIRIIRISDDPIESWSEDLRVKDGDIGEIIVRGEVVTRSYFQDPRATALAKIQDGDSFWHRMGDLAWRDSKGRVWFCGRKSHRVSTTGGDMFTIPCEAIFNNHPAVFRSALVGVGVRPRQTPVICIELDPDTKKTDRGQLTEALLKMAAASPLTRSIRHILYHPAFPVDIRHNSKIFREQLATWAARRVKDHSPEDDE
jgi:acyl-CoA synthetase (AMP-forming)/AMP-acid ligase II